MSDTNTSGSVYHRRWSNLRKILERSSPFAHPEYEPSPEILNFLQDTCKVLVVGAGGLGCELLKDLALMGFRNLHVIDMDTIDLSNLNRQFLFRHKDIGASKAEVAAQFINKRIRGGCCCVPYFAKIQDMDESFYRGFHIIVCGLDSVVARRWINGMVTSLLRYSDDVDATTAQVEPSSVIPVVDGGTEGFKGSARVIWPGRTACVECTLDLYPPQRVYPLCTIANTPRLPEHCVEYVKVVQWPREAPFNGCPLDGDDPQHISWVYEKAVDRANQFSITGVNYRLVQGVVKNIIPAVASTNAAIAGICATEVFKVATSCYQTLNNYMVFNDVDGIYTYTYEAERNPKCLACSCQTQTFHMQQPPTVTKLQDFLDTLCNDPLYQMKSPALTACIDGKNRTLYMSTVKSIEERTRDNLQKTFSDLGVVDGTEITVSDVTTPTPLVFHLKFATVDVVMKQTTAI